jgi:cellulose synthase/poly-beta-1,6-N-acetylglucosamine synthase-like glycosyltransferase
LCAATARERSSVLTMALSFLLQCDHVLFLSCLAIYCVLGSSFFWILIQYLRLRRRGMREEARLLSVPLPDDRDLPRVLMQLPTFNEGALIGRVCEAVGNLDWPRDRMEVQVLDDSTDGSGVYAERAVALLNGQGIDASVLHRTNRQGFKAGALAGGLQQSSAPFVAILDADYLPRPDFFKSCMRPMLHDAKLGLVQARCDFLNGNENLITRVQQRILDAHYAVEQAARGWSGQVVPFNGTCGIWRRSTIDDAGGWQGDTLAEDMDISYRAQVRGWRVLFLAGVTVPGELPNNFRSWRQQQFRWTKGSSEVARKMLGPVWQSPLRLDQKLISTLHLSGGLFVILFALSFVSGAIDLVFGAGLTWLVLGLIFAFEFEVIVGPALLRFVGERYARGGSITSGLCRFPLAAVLQSGVGLANLGGAIEAVFGHGTSFVRTPKSGRASDKVAVTK